MTDEYERLVRRNGKLMAELTQVRKRMAELSPGTWSGHDYRIALRPHGGIDPFDPSALMDDIVVNHPSCFRAEQMSKDSFWVACYLDEDTLDRVTWSVQARSRPLRIEWTLAETPDVATYEHELLGGGR